MALYSALDIFFMILHPAIIVFNCIGWIWKRTRRFNLLLLLFTAGSWFLLGIRKGWGYCFLTEWHYDILKKLGYHHLPSSYIKFMIGRLTGIEVSDTLVNVVTAMVFFLSLIISVVLNIRDWKGSKISYRL